MKCMQKDKNNECNVCECETMQVEVEYMITYNEMKNTAMGRTTPTSSRIKYGPPPPLKALS